MEANWNSGGNTSHFKATKVTDLNPGESTTLTAYYNDYDGVEMASTYTPSTGQYKTLTIKARSLRLRSVGAAIIPGKSNQPIPLGTDTYGNTYDGLINVVVAGDNNLDGANIRKGVSIFNVPGSYTGSSSSSVYDIDISNSRWYALGSSSTPSADATLTNTGRVILSHLNDKGYVYFDAKLDGVSGTKVYRIPIGFVG